MEVDILKETINILKKDPGVDWKKLKNREKVAVIDAMKEKYPLPILLRRMKLSRSSYCYQIKAFAAEDKYEYLCHEVVRIFLENKARYGYRRIHAELKKTGIKVAEKVVRRVMKEEGLEVKIRKVRKYSSYKGGFVLLFQTKYRGIFIARKQTNFFCQISVSLLFRQAKYICLRQ